MFKTHRSALSLLLASSLFLPACTVDAATASALLDSLKQGLANASTDEDGGVTSSALAEGEEATLASAPRRLRVTCGTDGQLRIASETSDSEEATSEDSEAVTSEDSSATETSDAAEETVTVTEETASEEAVEEAVEEAEEEVIEEADVIHPVVIEPPVPSAHTRPQPAKRLQLDVRIEAALRQLQQMRPEQRNTRFRELQRQYPQLQQVAPVQITVVNNYGQPTRHMYFEHQPPMPARPVMLPPQGQPGYGYAGPRGNTGYPPSYSYGSSRSFPGKQPVQRPVNSTSAAVDLSAYLDLEGLEIPSCNS